MNLRVAVIHPGLVPGGGSEACAMWTLQALQDDHRLTLITTGRPDLAGLNRQYGTDVDPGRVEGRLVGAPPGTRKRFDALRGFRLSRYCRRHASDFDLMISAYNVMDFGVPGIQRVADFSFDDRLRRELHTESRAGAFHGRSPLRTSYLALARALAGTGDDGWKRNTTIANSQWTRNMLLDRFGVASIVVYPPVAGGYPSVPWNEREDGFVAMGRLAPEKGLRRVIGILADVRRERPVHLHILGRRERNAFAREIDEICRRNGDWIHLEGEVYGPEKAAFLAGHKYGISGCRNEAFGIAVAEMVKAGMLVWVPDGGGQKEIVAHPGLIYASEDQAVLLIRTALGDPRVESALRAHLEVQAGLFSSRRFVGEMRAVVRDFLKEDHDRAA
jgi:glycosyltransferase involved in cell wall biosynthesis